MGRREEEMNRVKIGVKALKTSPMARKIFALECIAWGWIGAGVVGFIPLWLGFAISVPLFLIEFDALRNFCVDFEGLLK